MAAVLLASTCPNCGAPANVAANVQHVVCVYCNQSLAVHRAAGQAAPTLQKDDVPAATIEKVKQLLLDAKRGEAVALYTSAAKVDTAEAERVLDAMVFDDYFTLTAHLPLNAGGIVMHIVIWLVLAGGAAWLAREALAEQSVLAGALALVPTLLAAWVLRAFARHVSATITDKFGARGRGKVLRASKLRDMKGSELTMVLFEVTPDDGSAAFLDRETLNLSAEGVKKLSVGNSVYVRYDSAREHVYPISPMTVL